MSFSTLFPILAGLATAAAFLVGSIAPVLAYAAGRYAGRAVAVAPVSAPVPVRRARKPQTPRRAPKPQSQPKPKIDTMRDDPVFLHLRGLGFRIREIEGIWPKVEGSGSGVGGRLGAALKALGSST